MTWLMHWILTGLMSPNNYGNFEVTQCIKLSIFYFSNNKSPLLVKICQCQQILTNKQVFQKTVITYLQYRRKWPCLLKRRATAPTNMSACSQRNRSNIMKRNALFSTWGVVVGIIVIKQSIITKLQLIYAT